MNVNEKNTDNNIINSSEEVVKISQTIMLPTELYALIFSYLKPDTLTLVRLSCNKFNIIILDGIKKQEICLIKIALIIFKNLGNLPENEKNQLCIFVDLILSSTNLFDIKSSAFKLKELVVGIFKILKLEDIHVIEKLSSVENFSIYFGSLIELSNIYKTLDQVNTLPNDSWKTRKLEAIIEALVKNGSIDKAIEVSNTIHEEYFRSVSLAKSLEILIRNGNLNRGLNIAKTIPNTSIQSQVLAKISLELVNEGKVDKAIQVANTIDDTFIEDTSFRACRGVALSAISLGFAKNGNFYKAREIAEDIPSEGKRHRVLERISNIMKMEPNELNNYHPSQDINLIIDSWDFF